MSKTEILTKPMKAAIARSGYLMEQRLVPVIEKFGFKATANERFRDVETGDLRELDISAISAEQIGKRGYQFVFPVLLIACKNLECPLVFFTQQEIRLHYFLGQVQISGLPLEIPARNGEKTPLTEFLKFDQFHHYYRTGHIASQFCAVYKRKNGTKNNKENAECFETGHKIGGRIDLFKDFDGLAKVALANKREHGNSYFTDGKREPLNLQIYYPIFVSSGPIVECHVGTTRPSYRQVHRIGFLYRTEIGHKQRNIRIDVVDEDGFKRLLRTIDNETQETAKRLYRERKTIQQSLGSITKQLHRWKPGKQKAYVAGEFLE